MDVDVPLLDSQWMWRTQARGNGGGGRGREEKAGLSGAMVAAGEDGAQPPTHPGPQEGGRLAGGPRPGGLLGLCPWL